MLCAYTQNFFKLFANTDKLKFIRVPTQQLYIRKYCVTILLIRLGLLFMHHL